MVKLVETVETEFHQTLLVLEFLVLVVEVVELMMETMA
jgi:hypothetical protein